MRASLAVKRLGVAIGFAFLPIVARAQGSAAVIGMAIAKETGVPLPSVDVTHVESGRATFGDAEGTFVLRGLPAGPAHIRVRRVGFSPVAIEVNLVAGRADTVRVALPILSIRLSEVRVSDDACRGRGVIADERVAMILEQVQLNAERARLHAREFPYDIRMERLFAKDRGRGTVNARFRIDTSRVDTTMIGGDGDWRYRPGALFEPTRDEKLEVTTKMHVPQLADFADDAFVAAHCYRYAGVQLLEGRRMIHVLFQPARGVPAPDVSGSLWLDTATYQLHRSTLTFDHPSPQAYPRVEWHTEVNTWFRQLGDGHFVTDRIEQRTSGRAESGANVGLPLTETHRTLEVRYRDGRVVPPDR